MWADEIRLGIFFNWNLLFLLFNFNYYLMHFGPRSEKRNCTRKAFVFFPCFLQDLEIKSPFERSRLPLQTVWMEDIEDKKRCCTVFENKRFQILRRQQLFNDIDNRKTRWKRKNSIRNQWETLSISMYTQRNATQMMNHDETLISNFQN